MFVLLKHLVSMVNSAIPCSSASTIYRTEPYSSLSRDQTITEIVLDYIKNRINEIASGASYLAFWMGQAFPSHLPTFTKLYSTLRGCKNFISLTLIPEKLYRLAKSVDALAQLKLKGENVVKAARKVFKDSVLFINSIAEGIDFAGLFIPLSKEMMRLSIGMHSTLTFLAAHGIVEQLENIHSMDKIEPKKTTYYLIQLAKDVSYLAFGIISLVCLFTATPAIPVVMFSFLTSGFIFSMATYFYERLANPEGKNLTLPTVQGFRAQ